MTISGRPTIVAGPDLAQDVLLSGLRDLPLIAPMSHAVLDDPQASMSDIALTIARDPTLAMRILRIANSARFGLSNPVRHLTRAIQLMGLDMVREILKQQSALCILVLRPKSRPAISARLEGLWQHSIATGVAARALAKHLGVADVTPYYAAGLLHDSGKAALSLLRPQEYERCLWLAASDSIALVVAERQLLDFDHAGLGRRLCQFWGQPDEVADAVWRHHSVRSGGESGIFSDLAAVVHVADILARTCGIGWWGDRIMPRLDAVAREALHLRPADAVALIEQIEAEYPQTLAYLNALYPETLVP